MDGNADAATVAASRGSAETPLLGASEKGLRVPVHDDSDVDPVHNDGDVEEGLPCLPKGSVLSSAYLLAAMSLGVGVFVQPQVFASIGWVTGTILLLFFGVLSMCVQTLLIAVAQAHAGHASSYSALAYAVLGKAGLALCSLTLTLACTIGNAAHMQTIAQMLHDISSWYFTGTYDYAFDVKKRAVVIAMLLAFALPFCFGDDIAALRYASTLSVGTCTVLAVSVAVVAAIQLSHGLPEGAQPIPMFVWDAQGAKLHARPHPLVATHTHSVRCRRGFGVALALEAPPYSVTPSG